MNDASRKIKVTIDAMGNPKIEAENFNGANCTAATAPLEAALAGSNITRDLKDSYYNEATQGEQVQQTW
jgi:beta-lactam-binding protein with PASTA domain